MNPELNNPGLFMNFVLAANIGSYTLAAHQQQGICTQYVD